MAIKSILFNTDMVQAILRGQKTCTRRIMKPQPTAHYGTLCAKPPYQRGDILYVRETWGHPISLNSDKQYVFRADEMAEIGFKNDSHIWHPSIHMPKEAARIWLKVKDVRVERLQKCGEGWCIDIEKEGIVAPQDAILYISDDAFHDALRMEFQKTWDKTIKKSDLDRYGWNANPWVWVIEFERYEPMETPE